MKDLAFRFYQTPVEKLFDEIRAQVFSRVDVPENLASQLDEHLDLAERYCTFEWNNASPKLYRARKHGYGQLDKFPSKEMGPPPHHLATVGRAQPVGASLLYVADSAETAVSEVKPDVGEYLTVGIFKPKAAALLRVLDLTRFSANLGKH